MKFGQLNDITETFFLEKSYTKCRGKANSRSFHKKTKLSISLDQQPEMLYCFFLSYA